MREIVSVGKIIKLVKEFKKKSQTTVLVGGCFDILHPGHVIFLDKAKKLGNFLIVLLESDEKVKVLKGVNRPIHTQVRRAKVLLALRPIDFVVMLPFLKSDFDYDQLVAKIKPDIIAATKGYANIHHLKRCSKLVSASLKFVTKKVGNYSSSRVLTGKTI